MPLHTWNCTHCGKDVEVVRRIHEDATPPQPDELGPGEGGCDHVWAKVIRAAPGVVKGRGWGPGKGSWAVIFAILGSYVLR